MEPRAAKVHIAIKVLRLKLKLFLMNKKITVGLIGLATIVGVVGVTVATTYARGGGMMRGYDGNATSTAAISARQASMIAQRDAVNKAIEAGNYTAWKTAMAAITDNGREDSVTKVITEANFPKFVEMHKLMIQADVIRKEIGLDQYNGMRSGMMDGRGYGLSAGLGRARGMMGGIW